MIDTVLAHVDSGEIKPRKRMTADDLRFAATWLHGYEGGTEADEDGADDRENMVAAATVAAWCNREAERREKAQIKRAARRIARRRVKLMGSGQRVTAGSGFDPRSPTKGGQRWPRR